MVIAVVAQSNWKSPRAIGPFLGLGQRSYEVYLTHMFIVFAVFQLFVFAGKPRSAILALFIAVIVASGLLGETVGRFYSKPLNRLIRERWVRPKTAPATRLRPESASTTP